MANLGDLAFVLGSGLLGASGPTGVAAAQTGIRTRLAMKQEQADRQIEQQQLQEKQALEQAKVRTAAIGKLLQSKEVPESERPALQKLYAAGLVQTAGLPEQDAWKVAENTLPEPDKVSTSNPTIASLAYEAAGKDPKKALQIYKSLSSSAAEGRLPLKDKYLGPILQKLQEGGKLSGNDQKIVDMFRTIDPFNELIRAAIGGNSQPENKSSSNDEEMRLQQARDAIAQGIPEEEVKKKLKDEYNIDPGKL